MASNCKEDMRIYFRKSRKILKITIAVYMLFESIHNFEIDGEVRVY